MDRSDRNAFLMIIIILVVCIVSLVVVLVVSWRITGPAFRGIFSGTARYIHLQNLNYNFSVPKPTIVDEVIAEVEEEKDEVILAHDTASRSYDYNFKIPARSVDESTFHIQDAILSDAQLGLLETGQIANLGTRFNLEIPRIAVDSPVYQGLDAEELLKQGFWVYPSSGLLGQGEVVMLCHRRYFFPDDHRSCWYLDHVLKGDSMFVDVDGTKLEYEVDDVRIFEAEDPEIYNIDRNSDRIRIITCTPLYSDTHRLVVYAKRKI